MSPQEYQKRTDENLRNAKTYTWQALADSMIDGVTAANTVPGEVRDRSAADGYLIESRFGGAAAIDGSSVSSPHGMPATTRLRADLRVPVITLITETDLIGGGPFKGFFNARQPGTGRLRTWEIAGAAHADAYKFFVADMDSGSTPIAQLAAAYATAGARVRPLNLGPQAHPWNQTQRIARFLHRCARRRHAMAPADARRGSLPHLFPDGVPDRTMTTVLALDKWNSLAALGQRCWGLERVMGIE